MINDPMVEEIHRIREKLSREFHFDVRKIFEDVKKKERQHGDRLVNLRLKANIVPSQRI